MQLSNWKSLGGKVSIFRRSRKTEGRKGSFYYAIRNPLTGKYDKSKRSVAKVARELGIAIQPDAMEYIDAVYIIAKGIEQGLIKIVDNKRDDVFNPSLIEYVELICSYEKSPWVKSEAIRKGVPLSRKYVENLLRAFRLHAKPLLSGTIRFCEFSRQDADVLQQLMHNKGVSPDNINMALKAIRTAYNYAEQKGLVDINPMSAVKPFVTDAKERDILSKSEAAQLLHILQKYSVETYSRRVTYLSTKLAIRAGMRRSEILGLSKRKISRIINDDGIALEYYKITVDVKWDDTEKRLGPTKGKYRRNTVIHESLATEILAFADDYGRGQDDLIFQASKKANNKPSDNNRPVTGNLLLRYLYEALEDMGINEEERTARGIDFHSLRHFYDSATKDFAESAEPLKAAIRSAVGHKSKSVDELIYTHDTIAHLIALGFMSEHLLDTK